MCGHVSVGECSYSFLVTGVCVCVCVCVRACVRAPCWQEAEQLLSEARAELQRYAAEERQWVREGKEKEAALRAAEELVEKERRRGDEMEEEMRRVRTLLVEAEERMMAMREREREREREAERADCAAAPTDPVGGQCVRADSHCAEQHALRSDRTPPVISALVFVAWHGDCVPLFPACLPATSRRPPRLRWRSSGRSWRPWSAGRRGTGSCSPRR